MITQIPVYDDAIVAFRVTGKLTHEDCPIHYDEAYDPLITIDVEKEMTKIANAHMHDLLEKMNTPRLSGEIIAEPPKGVIPSQAEALDSDLIIMGKRRRGALDRLPGATTNGVMHHVRCEVLSIPLEDRA